MLWLCLQVTAAILVFSWVVSLTVCSTSIAYTKNYYFNQKGLKVIDDWFIQKTQISLYKIFKYVFKIFIAFIFSFRFVNHSMAIIIIRYTHHVFITLSQLYSSCTATEVFFTLASSKDSWREKVRCSLTMKDNMVRKSFRIILLYISIVVYSTSNLNIHHHFVSISITFRCIWKV